jgi:DNA-binding FadR family transcriptional regulator
MLTQAPRTRAETLAADIEARIIERRLRPGDPVGTIDEIREQTGYARSTVGEAIRLLSDRGSVEIRPGRGGGLFVADPNPVVRLRHTLLTVRSAPTTVEHAIAVREALELLIDTDAARHRTPEDIKDLRQHLRTLKKAAKNRDSFMRANWALHERIAKIGHNSMAQAVYVTMTRCIADLSSHADPDDDEPDTGYLERRVVIHEDLVAAIIAGDIERTKAAVEEHRGLLRPSPAS